MRLRCVIAGLLLASLACAGTRYEAEVEAEPRAKPPILLVDDFAVTPDDVVEDALGPAFDDESDDAEHAIAREFSGMLVDRLREKGVQAARAETASALPNDALILQGQFVTIQEGSRVARMTIGFGAGRQKLQVQAQMYQWTGAELRRIQTAEAQAHGDRAPGMGVPMAVGAVATGGVLVPALVSGGMNVTQEVVGELRPALARLANVIAENVATFYRQRGWL